MKILATIVLLSLSALSFAAPASRPVSDSAAILQRYTNEITSKHDAILSTGLVRQVLVTRDKSSLMESLLARTPAYLQHRNLEQKYSLIRTHVVAQNNRALMEAFLSQAPHLQHANQKQSILTSLDPPSSLRQAATGDGFTGNLCSTSADCQGTRTCLDISDGSSRCVPSDGLQKCTSDSDCIPEEECLSLSSGGFCFSRTFEPTPNPTSSPPPPSTPNPPGPKGFTGNLCSTDADCEPPRTCFDLNDLASRCIPSNGLQTCTVDNDCVPEERCVAVEDRSVCFSRTFESEPSIDPSPEEEPSSTPTSPDSGGFTGNLCSTDADCEHPRTCFDLNNLASRCIPSNGLQTCTVDDDCVPEERCVAVEDRSVCFSRTFEPEPSPSGTPTAGPKGFTGNLCSTDTDCNPPRTCFDLEDLASRCIPSNGLQTCTVDDDCVPEERCVAVEDSSVCFSRSFEPEPSPSPVVSPTLSPSPTPQPCIAVDSLQHLSSHQLVYREHRLAKVLCDKNDSCATPGHMVLFDGKGMMMRSYCDLMGGCATKVKYVNSPRYAKGLTIPSKSDNMVFTALAARYVTRAEERILSLAVRLGL